MSIYARRNPRGGGAAATAAELGAQLPRQRRPLGDDEFAAAYGAAPEDIDRIVEWAGAVGLRVVDASARRRRVLVEGTIATVDAAFAIGLNEYEEPELGRFRGREGSVYVPVALAGVVDGVFGLDTRPVGRSRRRPLRVEAVEWTELEQTPPVTPAQALPAPPWHGTFFPPTLAQLYQYPAFDGSGQNVAVFAFNGTADGDPHGGYSLPALRTYFEQVLGGKTPVLEDVVVRGPGNDPGPDTAASGQAGDSTGEVMLDLCVVGAMAPGAKIFVVFTEFTTQGWVDALTEIASGDRSIHVVSISYGNPEDDPRGAWTPMAVRAVNQAFEAAAARNITICCASGDDGSSDQVASGAHVDFPASSPYVLAVGGTRLVARNGAISRESVWNEALRSEGGTGGGVSAVFSKPTWQDGANVPRSANPPHVIGRGVPDVAAVADPTTGVVVMHIDGRHLEPIGGTSAAAPQWAALVARLNQGLGAPCGFVNPVLYARCARGILNDITAGNNGAYQAAPGWDACTGLGTPSGKKLLAALSGGVQRQAKKPPRPPRRRAA